MKKKVLLFVFMLLAGVLLVPSTQARALTQEEKNDLYKNWGSKNYEEIYGDGGKVVIDDLSQEVKDFLTSVGKDPQGAHITVTKDGVTTEYDVYRAVTVYGGSKNATVESSEIIMNGGLVKNIYGGTNGSSDESRVKNAKVTINGGTVGYDGQVYSNGTFVNARQGGFVYGGGNGGTVNNAEVVFNGGTVLEAVIASGSKGYTGKTAVIINAGSPYVAHAIDQANVGTAKIVVNSGSYPYIFDGYYWQNGHENNCSYVDNLEIEVWGGQQPIFRIGGIKENDKIVSATTKTKFSYKRGAGRLLPLSGDFGTIYDSKEVIPYITLNVKNGDNVATNDMVPVENGKIADKYLDELVEEVLKDSELTKEDIELYVDEELTKEYTDTVANDSSVAAVTVYLKGVHEYTLRFVYGDIEVSRTFKENHKMTDEELKAIIAELLDKAELSEEDLEKLELYFDEEMTEEVPEDYEITPMTKDLTLYAKLVQLRQEDSDDSTSTGDELEEIPNTADINLIAIIATIIAGGLGLGYTIKKRKFN